MAVNSASRRQKHRGKAQRRPHRVEPTQDDKANFGLADKNMSPSTGASSPAVIFLPCQRAEPLKVCFHLVRLRSLSLSTLLPPPLSAPPLSLFPSPSPSAGTLIMWVEGCLSPQHLPTKPARPNLMHLCPHILSVLVQRGEGEGRGGGGRVQRG